MLGLGVSLHVPLERVSTNGRWALGAPSVPTATHTLGETQESPKSSFVVAFVSGLATNLHEPWLNVSTRVRSSEFNAFVDQPAAAQNVRELQETELRESTKSGARVSGLGVLRHFPPLKVSMSASWDAPKPSSPTATQ